MIEWSESTLRSAASWKAFKEGKALADSGAVSAAKGGSSGWQGAVRVGKRMFRVSVTARSATDVETRCACPENQSTGALCAHAVAVGLMVFSPSKAPAVSATPSVSTAPPRSGTPAPSRAVPVSSWRVMLPAPWLAMLGKGKLAVTLQPVDEPPSAADETLSGWLADHRQGGGKMLNLHLDGERLASFLDSLMEHPRVVCGSAVVEVTGGARLPLADLRRDGDAVTLVPEKNEGAWKVFGRSLWNLRDASLGKLDAPEALPLPLLNGEPVSMPFADFVRDLERLHQTIVFPAGSWLEALHFVPIRPRVELLLDGTAPRLEARLQLHYGDADPVSPGRGEVADLPRIVGPDRCEVRDTLHELAALNRLHQAGFRVESDSSDCLILKGESSVFGFLASHLPALRHEWKIVESDRFKRSFGKVVTVEPRINLVGSGGDWLSFDIQFEASDGSLLPPAELRRLLRGGGGSQGKRVLVSNEISDLVEPLLGDLDLQQEGGHYRASKAAGEVIRKMREKFSKGSATSDLQENQTIVFPAVIKAQPRPYQTAGFGWLWDRVSNFGGALLADDMGLGKTLQAIALIERLFEAPVGNEEDSGVVLVVATASLLGNWKAEIERFVPGRKVRILHGSSRDREREKVAAGEVVLTSYGTLARDLAWYLKQSFRAVVVDEASLMRNPDTDHARAVSKLRASARIALTGTPVENGVRDLWSIFRFIQPGWLGGKEEFKQRYEQPLSDPATAPQTMERLKLKISPFILRRTKEQVAPELPTKLVIDEYCDLSPDQQAVYRDLMAEGRKQADAILDSGNRGAARMRILTALLRLRQTCCDLSLLGNDRFKQLLVSRRSAKLERLLELLDEAVAGNHRVLVFSQFQAQLIAIEETLRERGISSLRLDGQSRNRQELVDRFQKPDGPSVFLISLKAGGYGLNLTAADTVIHFDPWWNPAAEAQATDRAHRIGQTRPVTVYRLLTRGTVEEKVVAMQAKKRELASSIDEGGMGDPSGWSERELLDMFA